MSTTSHGPASRICWRRDRRRARWLEATPARARPLRMPDRAARRRAPPPEETGLLPDSPLPAGLPRPDRARRRARLLQRQDRPPPQRGRRHGPAMARPVCQGGPGRPEPERTAGDFHPGAGRRDQGPGLPVADRDRSAAIEVELPAPGRPRRQPRHHRRDLGHGDAPDPGRRRHQALAIPVLAVPRDPDFAAKAGRVLGLYSRVWDDKPFGDHEYVISSDEKTPSRPAAAAASPSRRESPAPCAATATTAAAPWPTWPPTTSTRPA